MKTFGKGIGIASEGETLLLYKTRHGINEIYGRKVRGKLRERERERAKKNESGSEMEKKGKGRRETKGKKEKGQCCYLL